MTASDDARARSRSAPAGGPGGRPRLPESERLVQALQLSLEVDERARLDEAAAHLEVPPSVYARRRVLAARMTVPSVQDADLQPVRDAGRELNARLAQLNAARAAAPGPVVLEAAELRDLRLALDQVFDAVSGAAGVFAARRAT